MTSPTEVTVFLNIMLLRLFQMKFNPDFSTNVSEMKENRTWEHVAAATR